MKKIILPRYTSERYYLLSEIEVRAHITSIAEDPLPNQKDTYGAIYLLWNCSNHSLNDFMDILENVILYIIRHDYFVSFDKLLFSIEVYNTLEANNTVIEKAFSILSSKYPESIVIIGVSNSLNGTCALESVLDFSHHVERLNKQLIILTVDKDNYVGFDPTSEPDAASDVEHYLLSSLDVRISEWSKSVLNIKDTDYSSVKSKSQGYTIALGIFVVAVLSVVTKIILSK